MTNKREVSYDYFENNRNQPSEDPFPEQKKSASHNLSLLTSMDQHSEDFLAYLFGETNQDIESNSFSDFIAQKIEALLLSPQSLLKELPVMPESVITLMSELKKDSFNINELIQIIKREPGMAADVIKIANSPLYKRSEKTVTNLKTAFMNMGANVLLEAVVSSYLKNLSPTTNIYFKHFGDKIWQHCLQTAQFSKLLMEDVKDKEEQSTGYLVGLLLNLGKMIIFQIMTEAFSHVDPNEKPNSQAFKKLINIYSNRLTYSIVKFWRLPDAILQAIALQNNKQISQNNLALVIYEANILSELESLLTAKQITDSEFSLRIEERLSSEKSRELAEKIQLG